MFHTNQPVSSAFTTVCLRFQKKVDYGKHHHRWIKSQILPLAVRGNIGGAVFEMAESHPIGRGTVQDLNGENGSGHPLCGA